MKCENIFIFWPEAPLTTIDIQYGDGFNFIATLLFYSLRSSYIIYT